MKSVARVQILVKDVYISRSANALENSMNQLWGKIVKQIWFFSLDTIISLGKEKMNSNELYFA